MRDGRIVYVVAKAPRAGQSKTRLCPPLDRPRAAALAEAFLLDTLTTVRAAGCEPRVICPSTEEQSALQGLVGDDVRVDVQSGRGLGDALSSAFVHGMAAAGGVAVLAADSPTLPPDILVDAFARLDRGADVALGPTEDGGYYLLAARALYSDLFADLPWGTDTVAATTLRRCRDAGRSVHLLPRWYDVDEPATLARLQRELQTGPRDAAAHTRAVITSWKRDVASEPSGGASPRSAA